MLVRMSVAWYQSGSNTCIAATKFVASKHMYNMCNCVSRIYIVRQSQTTKFTGARFDRLIPLCGPKPHRWMVVINHSFCQLTSIFLSPHPLLDKSAYMHAPVKIV